MSDDSNVRLLTAPLLSPPMITLTLLYNSSETRHPIILRAVPEKTYQSYLNQFTPSRLFRRAEVRDHHHNVFCIILFFRPNRYTINSFGGRCRVSHYQRVQVTAAPVILLPAGRFRLPAALRVRESAVETGMSSPAGLRPRIPAVSCKFVAPLSVVSTN